MTIHKANGLGFDFGFILDSYKYIFPMGIDLEYDSYN